MHDPYRLTPPFDGHLLSRFELGDIRTHRGTRRPCPGTGLPGSHKGNRNPDGAHRTHYGGGTNEETAPPFVYAVICHLQVSPINYPLSFRGTAIRSHGYKCALW
ncbi:hypothetical protein GCM10008997_31370 [Halomonas salifodinae]